MREAAERLELEPELTALDDGVVDVGVLFTTDGALAGGDLVLLGDDRGLQPAENLVPMVRAEVLAAPDGDRVAATLDAVSGHLTTANLRFLNWRVSAPRHPPPPPRRPPAWGGWRGGVWPAPPRGCPASAAGGSSPAGGSA